MTTVGFTRQDIHDAVNLIMEKIPSKDADEAATILATVIGCNKSVAKSLVAGALKNNLK